MEYSSFTYKITKKGRDTLGTTETRREQFSLTTSLLGREAITILKYLHRKPYGATYADIEKKFGSGTYDYWLNRLEDEGYIELTGRSKETEAQTLLGTTEKFRAYTALRAKVHSQEVQPWSSFTSPKAYNFSLLYEDKKIVGSIQPESDLDIFQTEN